MNGAAAALTTVSSIVDGTYLTTGLTAASGAVLTIYIQDAVNTQKAVTATRSNGGNLTGIDLYQNDLVCRSDDGTALSGTNLNTSDNNGATGISAIFAAASNASCVLAAGKNLWNASGQTLSPGTGATVTVPGNFTNKGTYNVGSGGTLNVTTNFINTGTFNAVTTNATIGITGNFTNSGTFNQTVGTVTMKGTGSGGTITSGGASFFNLTINGSGGTYTLQDAMAIAGTTGLTLTAGTLDASTNNYGITLTGAAGSIAGSGTFTARNGTVTFSGSASQTWNYLGSSSFYNFTHSSSGTLTLGVTNGKLTVTNALTNSGGIILINNITAGNYVFTGATISNTAVIQWNFGGAGSTAITGFTNDSTHGTVNYDLTSAGTCTMPLGSTYNNLASVGSGTGLLSAQGAVTINGTLTLPTGQYDANGKTTTITGLATVSGGTYKASTATQTFNGGLTISSGTFTGSSGGVACNGSLTLSGGTLTAPSGTFSVSGNWALSGSPTFTPGTNTVTLNGTSQTISGSTSFYNLTKIVSSADTLTFTDGTTQTVTNALTLQGAAGQLLTLQGSGVAGWTISVPATQTLSYLSVSHSTATTTTAAAGSTSTDGGSNVNWTFGGGATFIPGWASGATSGVVGSGVF